MRSRDLCLADRAQPTRARDRQSSRVERLELVLLRDLDPGASPGERFERPEAVEVGGRWRLGQDRDVPPGEFLEQAGRGPRGNAQHDECRPAGEQLVQRRRSRDGPVTGQGCAYGRVARQEARDGEPFGQLLGDPQVEGRAPAASDDRERHGGHAVKRATPCRPGGRRNLRFR
ncbi:MAG: hypothetical protein WKF78_02615 [Candidatus Limnocylindrales bacterium]